MNPHVFHHGPPLFAARVPDQPPEANRAECHTCGTLGRHDAGMDDIYLCPDCRCEHSEPYEAVLGHLARCMGCAMLLEALADEAALEARIFEIRVAA